MFATERIKVHPIMDLRSNRHHHHHHQQQQQEVKRRTDNNSTSDSGVIKCSRWDPTENCDIFWKCRNKKKRVTSSEIGRRNDFDRDKSSPYTKRDSLQQPLNNHHTQTTTCLPSSTTSSSYNYAATSNDHLLEQNNQHQLSSSSSSRRATAAISVYSNDQLHEQDFWCPRCNGKMEEPRLLACLHSVCNYCVNEFMSKDYHGLSRLVRDQLDGFQVQRQQEGCPICDFPLPKYGSPAPPPHYSLQHRLVIYAVRRRLSQRAICCDSCPDEVQAVQHCPTCLCNFCEDCGLEHEDSESHQVRPLWEAKRIRHVAVCLEHPTRELRYHCLACQQVTCKECMWQQNGHRGHASEDAASAGAQAQIHIAAALKRAKILLNCLLMEYKERACTKDDEEEKRAKTAFDLAGDSMHYNHQRSRSTLSSHSREARERIHEHQRLRRARFLIDAIFIGEDLLANGSDVEILSLKHVILKRLKFLGVPVDSSARFNNNAGTSTTTTTTTQHSGIYHCCTFCSSGGKKEATCACTGTMPGGYKGCGHGHPGHPGVHHWSCCGSIYRDGICLLPRKCSFKITL